MKTIDVPKPQKPPKHQDSPPTGKSWGRKAVIFLSITFFIVVLGFYIISRVTDLPKASQSPSVEDSTTLFPEGFFIPPPTTGGTNTTSQHSASVFPNGMTAINGHTPPVPPLNRIAPAPLTSNRTSAYLITQNPLTKNDTQKTSIPRGQAIAKINRKAKPTTDGENFVVSQKNMSSNWNEPSIFTSTPTDMSRVVTVAKYFPAILVTAIRAELPGKVIATIEKNIYGSHGRLVLIPAGSHAIGIYKPLTKIGQERLAIQWIRIITPSGINIHLGDALVADKMGRSGVDGEIDARYFDRYGIALMTSVLTAATAYSVPVRSENQQLVVESLGREVSGLSRSILQEHMDIKPIVSIPQGTRIAITATQDIWFPPPDKNKNVFVKPIQG